MRPSASTADVTSADLARDRATPSFAPSSLARSSSVAATDREARYTLFTILYINAHSPGSAAAIANIKRVVSRFHPSSVKLTVCDLSKTPQHGEADSIAFTPTLVRRGPGPRTYILGHLPNPDLLLEMLGD